jgi:glutamate-ammonia-ligase adenylyltransferase
MQDADQLRTEAAATACDECKARLDVLRLEAPEIAAQIVAQPRIAQSLPIVWSNSEFIATTCLRTPPLIIDLARDGRLFESSDEVWLGADLDMEAAQATTEEDIQRVLRVFRRRHMVRIGWRDLANWAPLEETLRDLSDLADICIRFACQRATALLSTRHGQPRSGSNSDAAVESGTEQELVILGMGKLGGRELNYSSDIDLVFLLPESGATDGARSIDNEEFFLRLGQRVINWLANITVDGFVFRVDMRLRPFGDSGPMATSFNAFELYLQHHGRDWERYAYVKARPITGRERYQPLYDHILRPFVYRRYLDFSVFDALRSMKEMIAREVERSELHNNIKLGRGGIREIEFIVQAFQLIRGGSDRRLQARELLRVLPLLNRQKLLSATTVSELRAAYLFLRRLENRLQEWSDQQTHTLPEEPAALQRLAHAMGESHWSQLESQLNRHRGIVAGHFANVVFGPRESSAPHESSEVENLLEGEAGSPERESAVGSLGIVAAAEVVKVLDRLRDSGYYRHLDEIGRRRVQQLMPRLLRQLSSSEHQLPTLERLLKIVEKIGGRTVYLALLHDNPIVLARVVDLCERSQFLADQVATSPLLLDELIDDRLLAEPPTRAQFEEELASRLTSMDDSDPERQIEVLKQFQRAAMFRIAVADLTDRLPLMKVSDRLTDLAELIVRAALEFATHQMTARHGRPQCVVDGKTHAVNITVIAYGKLGGIELGYSSDLDLVFLHDSSGELQRTDGTQPIDNTVFFARLAQRLMHLLTTHTRAGRLYEVDTRLRPSGQKGLLVQSMDGFIHYQYREAWTWEHQALLRARAVAGDAALSERFEIARIQILRKAVRRDGLRNEVRTMRERMRAELSKAHAGQFDLKQDAGGIADIEFLVQYWMLNWADEFPPLIIFSDNIRQLESLASGALLPQQQVDFLTETYRKYRARMHHLSLDGGEGLIPDHEFRSERAAVIALWNEVMEA